jgi:Tfp pilus assembly protein PilX
MRPPPRSHRSGYSPPRGAKYPGQAGFALVITLALLALLVLALYALSALSRVSDQVSASGAYQTQARQNALLALDVGLSELQRHAGDDTRLTGMAGLAGVAAGASNRTRHWCGVWRDDGSFVAWLTSGAQTTGAVAVQNGLPTIELVSAGSVGAAATNSEHVIAGKLPVTIAEAPGAPGVAATIGRYAYLVTDEGAKISAYAPPEELRLAGVKPVLASTSATSAQGKLRATLDTYAAQLPSILSYAQLSLLPSPSAPLTPSVLHDNFHHATLTARSVSDGRYYAGTINLNTASAIVWRSILETYNSAPGATPLSNADLASRGNAIAGGFAASGSGKAVNGPFTSVAAFGGSALLSGNLPGSITAAQFMNAIGPLLTVRSDTFRIRAYGEALNPVDNGTIEAAAYGEAIVQRTLDPAPHGLGRRFVVTYFRWLGPDDL